MVSFNGKSSGLHFNINLSHIFTGSWNFGHALILLLKKITCGKKFKEINLCKGLVLKISFLLQTYSIFFLPEKFLISLLTKKIFIFKKKFQVPSTRTCTKELELSPKSSVINKRKTSVLQISLITFHSKISWNPFSVIRFFFYLRPRVIFSLNLIVFLKISSLSA